MNPIKLSLLFLFVLVLFSTLATKNLGQNQKVIEFVTKHYIHGVPYKAAKELGPEAIPDLALLLNNPRYETYRPNIVATIGMIGDGSGVAILKNYFDSQSGEISQPNFNSILVVFQSMGHIAHYGNNDALNFLKTWCNPTHLKSNFPSFSFQNYKGLTLNEVLGRMAIQGLGISGTESAYQTLINLDKATQKLKSSNGWEWSDNTSEAMAFNLRIRKEGMLKVFSTE